MKNTSKPIHRNRILYAILILTTILLGLASRKFAHILPRFLALYSGDTLWALMVFLLLGFIFPRLSTARTTTAATVLSFTIELSQLYHSPWIDAIRHTRLGGLALGYGFLWSDLLCYMIGIILGTAVESIYKTKQDL